MSRAARCSVWLAAAAVACASSVVLAHGREPSVGLIAFDPSDRDHFVLRGTWALLTTRDDGASFQWTCAVAAGFDRFTEDPVVAIAPSGHVVLATFDGLRRSDASACEYGAVTGDALGAFVIDLASDPTDPRVLWAARSPGDAENSILRSTDAGATFETVHAFPFGFLVERVRVAPSNASVVYASGAAPRRDDMPRRALFFTSTDRGETFTETEIPLMDGERNAHVLAVDPNGARRVLVRMTRPITDVVPERLLLSEDGGATFRTVLELREMVGVIFSHDGARAWAGSWDGGLFRSEDAGRTWTAVDAALRVRCLAEREDDGGGRELFVCVDELTEPYSVARSYDDGQTLERLWGFDDATNDVGCSTCTAVGVVCPSYWPDVEYDLETRGDLSDAGPLPDLLDAGPPPVCEAGTSFDAALPDAARFATPPRGCACAAGARPARFAWGYLVLGMWAARRRRAANRRRP